MPNRPPELTARPGPWRHRLALTIAPWLCAACVLVTAASASAQGRARGHESHVAQKSVDYRVGVVLVTTLGVTEGEAEALSIRLGQALETKLLIDVEIGTRANLSGSVAETCVTDKACIRKLGAALNARELLFLALVRIGTRLQLNVTWADVASGATEPRDPVRVEAVDDERELFLQAATRLIPNARRRAQTADQAAGTATPTVERTPDEMTGAVNPFDSTPTQQPAGPPGRTGAFDNPHTDGPDHGRHMTTGAWIAGGVSVAALAGSLAVGARALQTRRELEDAQCDTEACNVPVSRLDTLKRQINLSDGLLATAVVAGVVTGVLFWRSDSGRARTMAVAPTSGGLQLSLSGSF